MRVSVCVCVCVRVCVCVNCSPTIASSSELKDLRSSLEGEVNASLSYGTGDVTSSHKVPSSHKPHEK